MAFWTLFILLIYYVVFVRAPTVSKPKAADHLNLQNHLIGLDGKVIRKFQKAFVGGKELPDFNHEFTANEIRAGNTVWTYTLPSADFVWTQDKKIARVDACHGKQPGELIPARKIPYDFPAQRGNFAGSERFTNVVDSTFYYECGPNGIIDKLYYCPENTVFQHGKCTESNPCEGKQDGYKFPAGNYLQSVYFECVQGAAKERKCPLHEIFITSTCTKPDDPCIYLPDETIVRSNSRGYDICQNGKLVEIRCRSNEYFHDDSRRCITNICEGKDGEYIPHTIRDRSFEFAESYTKCENGVPHRMDCPEEVYDTFSPVQTQVFYQDQCQQPKMCLNVKPIDEKKTRLPTITYRSRMSNYKYSEILDHLSGYRCENGREHFEVLPENTKINSYTFELESFCEPGDERVARIESETPSFLEYFNCKTGRVETCPPSTFFDPQKKSCIPKPFDTFKLGNLPVFHLDNVNPRSNWLQPSLPALNFPSCDANEKRLSGYNVCVDPDCDKYGFLVQMPGKQRIYLDDTHQCQLTDENKIKVEPVFQEKEALDFWQQRFTAISKPCIPGFNLYSGNFLMDSTLYVTCTRSEPFIFCPTTNRKNVLTKEHLLQPVDYESIYEANTPHVLKTKNVKAFTVIAQHHTYELTVDGQTKSFPKMSVYVPSSLFQIRGVNCIVSCTEDFWVSFIYIPTNSWEYNFVNRTVAKQRIDYTTLQPTSQELELPRYNTYSWTLEGLS